MKRLEKHPSTSTARTTEADLHRDRRELVDECVAAALATGEPSRLRPALAAEALSLENFGVGKSHLAEYAEAIRGLPVSPERSAVLAFVRIWSGPGDVSDQVTGLGAVEDLASRDPLVAAALGISGGLVLLERAQWTMAGAFAQRGLEAIQVIEEVTPPGPAPDPEKSGLWFMAMAVSTLVEWNTYNGEHHFRLLIAELARVRERGSARGHHVPALVAVGRVLMGHGEYLHAVTLLRRAVFLLPDLPSMTRISAQALLSLALYRAGDWKHAHQMSQAVVAAAPEAEDTWPLSVGAALEALVAAAEGAPELPEILAKAESVASTRSIVVAQNILLHAQLISALYQRQGNTLRQLCAEAEDMAYRSLYDEDEWMWWKATSALFLTDGLQRQRILTEWASQASAEESCGYWMHRALSAEADGRVVDAVEAATQVQGRVTGGEDPVVRMFSLIEAGGLVIRHGEQQRGSKMITTALSEATVLNAQPLISLGRKRLGSDPLAILTQRQREIAELIGRGFTSAEAAAQLYVSARTVDFHVANILDRLGLSRRRQLHTLLDGF